MHDKKERIITTAQKLFARFGMKKTTVDEIAKAAQIGKGTIYHYFGSKEEIFAAVIEKEIEYMKKQIEQAVNQVDTPQAKLRTFLLTRMRCVKDLGNYYSVIRDEYVEYMPFIENYRVTHDQYEMMLVQNWLEEGKAAGNFDIEDTKVVASVMITAFKGLDYRWAFEMSAADVEHHIEVMLNVLFKGLEKRQQ